MPSAIKVPNGIVVSKVLCFLTVLAGLMMPGPVRAQFQYSVNQVAYVDAQLVAGLNLFSLPLNKETVTIRSLLERLPNGSVYSEWDPAAKQFVPVTTNANEAGWVRVDQPLWRAEAGFLRLPEARTLSFVGEPWPAICLQIWNTNSMATGVWPEYSCDNENQRISWRGAMLFRWDRHLQQFSPGVEVSGDWQPTAPKLATDEGVFIDFRSPAILNNRGRSAGSSGSPTPTATLSNPIRVADTFEFSFSSPGGGLAYAIQGRGDSTGNQWQTLLTGTTPAFGNNVLIRMPVAGRYSTFRIQSLRLLRPVRTPGRFEFQMETELGVRYEVQRTTSISSPTWVTVSTFLGTGELTTVEDPATAAESCYRVRY